MLSRLRHNHWPADRFETHILAQVGWLEPVSADLEFQDHKWRKR